MDLMETSSVSSLCSASSGTDLSSGERGTDGPSVGTGRTSVRTPSSSVVGDWSGHKRNDYGDSDLSVTDNSSSGTGIGPDSGGFGPVSEF